MTPEVQAQISIIRQKMIEGTATIEELRGAVELMRAGRKTAASAAASSTKRGASVGKPKAQLGSADDMLDELGNI